MRDMIDLYRYPRGRGSTEPAGRFASTAEAIRAAGHPDLADWRQIDNRYVIGVDSG